MIKLDLIRQHPSLILLPICCAGIVSTASTADSVNVIFNSVGKVVVDNITNRVNIKSAGGDVSSDKGRYATVTKLFQDAFTLSLILKPSSKCIFDSLDIPYRHEWPHMFEASTCLVARLDDHIHVSYR